MSKPTDVEAFNSAPVEEVETMDQFRARLKQAAKDPQAYLAATSTVPNQTVPHDTAPAAAATEPPAPAPAVAPAPLPESSTVPNHTEPHATAPDLTAPHVAEPARTVPKARKPKALPWADANPAIPVGFNLRLDQVRHAKAQFICANLPRMSQQKLYIQAIDREFDRLIKEILREGEGA